MVDYCQQNIDLYQSQHCLKPANLAEYNKYKDKDCVYILNVQDDIYKYGQSHRLNNRLGQHKKNLDYISIAKIGRAHV